MKLKENNFEKESGSTEAQSEKVAEGHTEISLEQPLNAESQKDFDAYVSKKGEIKKQLQLNAEAIEFLINKINEVRERLKMQEAGTEYVPSLTGLRKKQKELELEKIKVSANYPGDWTLLLRKRMLDPITKQKFVETRTAAMQNMKPGEVPEIDEINLVKATSYQSHYQDQIDNYDQNVEKIFSKTHIGESKEFDKKSENVGLGKIGYEGAVFVDTDLSVREKNIIESHEKGHGLRDFVSEDARDFRQTIDFEVIRQNDKETGNREIGYFRKPEEIAERMAQLKNYFGFEATDVFTSAHLEYAKKHYIQDTGYDNNMLIFLNSITSQTQDKFIETINRYPL